MKITILKQIIQIHAFKIDVHHHSSLNNKLSSYLTWFLFFDLVLSFSLSILISHENVSRLENINQESKIAICDCSFCVVLDNNIFWMYK